MTEPHLEVALMERLARVRLVAFDFDGVFTDNFVYTFQDGREAVRSWRGDGLGLSQLKRLGIAAVIISTEANPVVSVRAAKLKLPCYQGLGDDKLAKLTSVAAELGVSLDQTAYVGNDVNDLTCLRAVGLPIIVADAHPQLRPYAAVQTRTPGGQGAVREVCDWIQAAHDQRSI